MPVTHYSLGTMKRYSLEIYLSAAPEKQLWKKDADAPFTPMGRGDALILPELPEACFGDRYRIDDIEHVVWLPQEEVRFVTRLFVTLQR